MDCTFFGYFGLCALTIKGKGFGCLARTIPRNNFITTCKNAKDAKTQGLAKCHFITLCSVKNHFLYSKIYFELAVKKCYQHISMLNLHFFLVMQETNPLCLSLLLFPNRSKFCCSNESGTKRHFKAYRDHGK